jgi:hypothetical protein
VEEVRAILEQTLNPETMILNQNVNTLKHVFSLGRVVEIPCGHPLFSMLQEREWVSNPITEISTLSKAQKKKQKVERKEKLGISKGLIQRIKDNIQQENNYQQGIWRAKGSNGGDCGENYGRENYGGENTNSHRLGPLGNENSNTYLKGMPHQNTNHNENPYAPVQVRLTQFITESLQVAKAEAEVEREVNRKNFKKGRSGEGPLKDSSTA